MNDIATAVGFVEFSDKTSWEAIAVVNGKRTSICCMHNHSRKDLAEKCAGKYFTRFTAPLPQADLVDLGDGTMEARWTDNQNRSVTRRFRYLPESDSQ